MKKVSLSDARAHISELIDDVCTGGESIIIRKRNKEVAVLVAFEHFQRLKDLEDRFRSLRLREALKGKRYPLREVLAQMCPGVS